MGRVSVCCYYVLKSVSIFHLNMLLVLCKGFPSEAEDSIYRTKSFFCRHWVALEVVLEASFNTFHLDFEQPSKLQNDLTASSCIFPSARSIFCCWVGSWRRAVVRPVSVEWAIEKRVTKHDLSFNCQVLVDCWTFFPSWILSPLVPGVLWIANLKLFPPLIELSDPR
jgi:hypothetical protein